MEPTQPTPAPYQPQTPPASPMPTFPSSEISKQGRWKTPVAIIIGALVIAGGAYAWIQRAPVTPVAELTPSPTACTQEAKICPDGSSVGRTGPACKFAACPEPTSAVPKDWKTYTNTQYGFEFKYPAQWPSPASYTVGFTGAAESFLGQSKWGYEFGIKKDIEGSLSSSYYMGAYPASDRSIILQKLKSSEQYKGGLVTIKDATLTIGGFPAIRYDEGGLCGYPSAMIFTPRYTLKIVSNCNNESSDPFDQILSTFKFIEPTAAVPADWKTYTNTKYGFEFRYPAAWVTTQHSGNGLLQIFALPKESQNTDRNDGVNLGIMSQKQFGDNYSEATVSGKPANAIAGFTTYEFIHQGQIGAPSKISYFVFQNNYFVFSRNTTNAEAEQSIFTFRFSK